MHRLFWLAAVAIVGIIAYLLWAVIRIESLWITNPEDGFIHDVDATTVISNNVIIIDSRPRQAMHFASASLYTPGTLISIDDGKYLGQQLFIMNSTEDQFDFAYRRDSFGALTKKLRLEAKGSISLYWDGVENWVPTVANYILLDP